MKEDGAMGDKNHPGFGTTIGSQKLWTNSRFLAGRSTEIEKFCLLMKRLKFHP
jgi:hypothetical protein